MSSNSVAPAPSRVTAEDKRNSASANISVLPTTEANIYPAVPEGGQSLHSEVRDATEETRQNHTTTILATVPGVSPYSEAVSAGPSGLPADLHGNAAHVDANASVFSLSANMGAQWEAEGVRAPASAHLNDESSPRSTHIFQDDAHIQLEEIHSPLSGPSTQAGDPLTPLPDDPSPEPANEVEPVPEVMRKLHFQLIPFAAQGQQPNPTVECVERKIREGEVVRIGRKVVKNGYDGTAERQDDGPLNIWYVSKVVSRNHAEMWISDGQLFIKDIGSSSGTFLNKMRLSPSGKASQPYTVRENDLVVFGIDYKGKSHDDFYRQLRKKADTKK
ncbi:hypothetical protein HDU84_003094 [Entophlyctis sp. JEL0112]|nr:hypothetical protein HDU84_003094 [Entophlyctis sp. JEL0112]